MMVSMREERGVVAEMYPSRKWKRKVDQMPDYQVHAIYLKHMAEQSKDDKPEPDKPDQIPF